MSLVRVELRRFYSRRLTKGAALAVLVILGFVLFGMQQQTYDAVPARVAERAQQQKQECLNFQAEAQKNDPTADFQCDQNVQMDQPQVTFVSLTRDVSQSLALLFAGVGFLIGATFLAAEFTSGAIGNWLTFEPRRGRVYFSKLTAAALGSLPLTAVGLAILAGGAAFVTNHYGLAGTVTAAQRGDLVWLAVRILVIGAGATVGGAVLGALLRNTAAALGVTVGYLILVEGIFPALILRFVPDPRPWLFQGNFQAWVNHGFTYYVSSCDGSGASGPQQCDGIERQISFGHSAAYFGVILTLFVALGAWVFHRRDIS